MAKDERKIPAVCLLCIKAVFCTTLSKALPLFPYLVHGQQTDAHELYWQTEHGGSIPFWDEQLYPPLYSVLTIFVTSLVLCTGVFFELARILLLHNIVLMMLVHSLFFHTGNKHADVIQRNRRLLCDCAFSGSHHHYKVTVDRRQKHDCGGIFVPAENDMVCRRERAVKVGFELRKHVLFIAACRHRESEQPETDIQKEESTAETVSDDRICLHRGLSPST